MLLLSQYSKPNGSIHGEVMTVPLYLPDDGGALQLITSSGEIADTVVWVMEHHNRGWSGTSVMMSVSDIDNYIYLGDNCGEFSDTNTSADWMHRWSVLGATTICNQDTVQSSGGNTSTGT